MQTYLNLRVKLCPRSAQHSLARTPNTSDIPVDLHPERHVGCSQGAGEHRIKQNGKRHLSAHMWISAMCIQLSIL
jgi:hypothetical protein